MGEAPLGPPLLGALLRRPGDVIRQRMLARLHAEGFSDLTPPHMIVLRYPGPEGLRPIDLADQMGMSKQALNYLLGQLEELGYLSRDEDPDDQRAKRIRMADRGYAAGRVMRAAVTEVENEFADATSKKDLEALRSLLASLNDVLDHGPADWPWSNSFVFWVPAGTCFGEPTVARALSRLGAGLLPFAFGMPAARHLDLHLDGLPTRVVRSHLEGGVDLLGDNLRGRLEGLGEAAWLKPIVDVLSEQSSMRCTGRRAADIIHRHQCLRKSGLMRSRLCVLGILLLALLFPAQALSAKKVYIGPAGPGPSSSVGVVVKFKKGKPRKVTLFEWNNIPLTCTGSFTSATSDNFGRDIRVNRKRKFQGSSSINGGQSKVKFSAKISRNGKQITGSIRVHGTFPSCSGGDSGRVSWKSVPRKPAL